MQIRERYPLPEKANIIMDTTYFGRSFGVMVLMDSISQQALSVDEVKYETNALYAAALNELREKGVEIQSIVCDGRKGLLQMFPAYRTKKELSIVRHGEIILYKLDFILSFHPVMTPHCALSQQSAHPAN